MTIENYIHDIRSLLNAYYTPDAARGVATDADSDFGVPPDMQVGPVDDEGWVQWRILEPRITLADVAAFESRCKIFLPDYFRAYGWITNC